MPKRTGEAGDGRRWQEMAGCGMTADGPAEDIAMMGTAAKWSFCFESLGKKNLFDMDEMFCGNQSNGKSTNIPF